MLRVHVSGNGEATGADQKSLLHADSESGRGGLRSPNPERLLRSTLHLSG